MATIGSSEGWWLASDGNWYPPELHPDRQPTATSEPAATTSSPATVGTTSGNNGEAIMGPGSRYERLVSGGTCVVCGATLPPGAPGWRDPETGGVSCPTCPPTQPRGRSGAEPLGAAPGEEARPGPRGPSNPGAASGYSPSNPELWGEASPASSPYSPYVPSNPGAVGGYSPPSTGIPQDALPTSSPYSPSAPFNLPKTEPGIAGTASPSPPTTGTWFRGSGGEPSALRTVQEALAGRACMLTDRKIPGGLAQLDLLVVASSGVWVVSSRRSHGLIEYKNAGGPLRNDRRLVIGGTDETASVEQLAGDLVPVTSIIANPTIPVSAALVLVDGDWGGKSALRMLAKRPYRHLGVYVTWPAALIKIIEQPGPLSPDGIQSMTGILERKLPSG